MGARRYLVLLLCLALVCGCSAPELQPWHTVELKQEFAAGSEAVSSFDAYLDLEDRLFEELSAQIYNGGVNPGEYMSRYRAGSAADPRGRRPDWNRTVVFGAENPRGGVLLLHGMSDAPYSLRSFAKALTEAGYSVIVLRYPGHGTAPSGLRHIRHRDLTAAVRLAMDHLSQRSPGLPLHLIGYSTGATLALEYTLDALEEETLRVPRSLVLLSPAIRVHASASLAGFKNGLARLPGGDSLAWLNVLPETDPYKYNSFATNAAAVVNSLTRSVDRRIAAWVRDGKADAMPAVLAIKSTVDTTVTTEAVVDNLLLPLGAGGHELLLFDINQYANRRGQLAANRDAFTRRLAQQRKLPFTFTQVGNESPDTRRVVARTRPAFASDMLEPVALEAPWPEDVLSLSHIALPFPPDDPLYGARAPEGADLWLGNLSMRGERGVSAFPPDFLLRMRYNPFFDYTLARVLTWLADAGETDSP